MKYHCKYPNKLTLKGYAQKKCEVYKSSGRYSGLSDEELETLLGYVLLEIHITLCSSKERLPQSIELLLKMGSMTREECLDLSEDWEEASNSIGALSLIMHDTVAALDVIANNRKIEFRSDKQSHYVGFLKEVTANCIREVTEANQPKPTMKSVRFSDDALPKSEASPTPPREAVQESGAMNYQYTSHKSLDKRDQKESESTRSKTFKLGKVIKL